MSSSVVLVCAVMASLAAGVLVAYMACQAVFAIFNSHARQIAEAPKTGVAIASQIVEG